MRFHENRVRSSMSEKVEHIILTRFNSVLDHEFTKALDPTWIRERWALFTRYTVPSMLSQSCPDFYWIVEFHPQSPTFLRSLIQTAGWPSHFIASFGERERIAQSLGLCQCESILTSRLDSDDGFHRDAVYRIQSTEHNCDILNFEHGYQCDHVTGCVALTHRDSSPFSTKINRRSRGDDPFDVGGDHGALSSKFSYRDISGGDPLYLQVLHGRNVGNTWYGNPFNSRALSRLILAKCFNVEQSAFPMAQRLVRMTGYEVQRLPRCAKRALVSVRAPRENRNEEKFLMRPCHAKLMQRQRPGESNQEDELDQTRKSLHPLSSVRKSA